MKTITTLLFSLCFLLTLNAQVKIEVLGKANTSFVKINNSIYPPPTIVDLNPSTGGTTSTYNQPEDVYRITSPKVGFNLGAQILYSFPSKIQVGTGLVWNRFSFVQTNNTMEYKSTMNIFSGSSSRKEIEYEIDQQINYLSIPIKFRMELKDRFNIGVSLLSNVLIHSRHEKGETAVLSETITEYNHIDPDAPQGVIVGEMILRDEITSGSSNSRSNKISYFEDFQWGGSVNFSYRIRQHLFIDLEYLILFDGIYSDQYYVDEIIQRQGNLGSLSLGLGYRF